MKTLQLDYIYGDMYVHTLPDIHRTEPPIHIRFAEYVEPSRLLQGSKLIAIGQQSYPLDWRGVMAEGPPIASLYVFGM